jgi:hypothetical protein
MRMSFWLIVTVALALLVGFIALRHRTRPRDPVAADSTTQVAALRAPPEPAAADAAAADAAPVVAAPAEALSVRAETLRALHELAFAITLPPAAAQALPDDGISAEIGEALSAIVDKPNYAPRRPMQLPKLMRAINDETAICCDWPTVRSIATAPSPSRAWIAPWRCSASKVCAR